MAKLMSNEGEEGENGGPENAGPKAVKNH